MWDTGVAFPVLGEWQPEWATQRLEDLVGTRRARTRSWKRQAREKGKPSVDGRPKRFQGRLSTHGAGRMARSTWQGPAESDQSEESIVRRFYMQPLCVLVREVAVRNST